MNKYIYIIVLFLFCSCQEESILENKIEAGDTNGLKSTTIHTSISFDWESEPKINLIGYANNILLPWYNGAETQLPFDILKDYKSSDGWVMFYNYCTDAAEAKVGKYYLSFYNIFTGVMRVYYYNTYNVTGASTTFWTVKLENASSLLNSSGYFTNPYSVKPTKPEYYTSNITTNQAKAITRGWNCFDVEFTYDPDFDLRRYNQHMNIGAYDVTTSEVKLDGDVTLSSEGTIISTTSNTSTTQTILNSSVAAAGSSAGTLIKNKLTKDANGNTTKNFFPNLGAAAISSIADGGVSEFVKYGLNLVFGSFLGGGSKETKEVINLKTTGSFRVTGTINTPSSSNILGLSQLLLPGAQSSSSDFFYPSYNQTFGAWNLSKSPVMKYSDETIYFRYKSSGGGTASPYTVVRSFSLDLNSIDVKLNPSISDKIEKYTVKTDLVYYKRFRGDYDLSSVLPNLSHEGQNVSGECIYKDDTKQNETEIILNPSFNLLSIPNVVYGEDWSSSRVEVICKRGGAIPAKGCVVKVTVTLYPKAPYNTSPIVMTRSYLPEYQKTVGTLDYFKYYFQ
ncbi:hypothetical protein KL86DYS2_13165 [uncultured Dysgonomonas sp.]|uniref:Uncharacterized protein n=1 Tax=uncultured Dysgonomonas sp. TaxID=206096 RepID=A0A212K6V6_9BACT|nr:hypothetical protein [uncultured Dysgonomonas sp.]SBW07444.1 hypothetical protein KL86DYS2_13165 [uncultured Dysgonomonas sp.]